MAAPRKGKQQVELSLTEHAGVKLKPYLFLFGGIGTVLTVAGLFGNWWISAGNWTPAGMKNLEELRGEVSKQLDITEKKVTSHSDRNTLAVQKDVGAVSNSVEKLSRTVLRSQIEGLRTQQANLEWSQLPQQRTQLAGIERNLAEPGRANDQFLVQRQAEVKSAISRVEENIKDIKERIRKLEEQL